MKSLVVPLRPPIGDDEAARFILIFLNPPSTLGIGVSRQRPAGVLCNHGIVRLGQLC